MNVRAGGERQQPIARPATPLVAGTILLTADQVVHELLNFGSIRDPDRWLRRQGAPVAVHTGPIKRYLAADVLRWVASKFATGEESRRTLSEIAARFEVGIEPVQEDRNAASADVSRK